MGDGGRGEEDAACGLPMSIACSVLRIGDCALEIGYWVLRIGYWALQIGYWVLRIADCVLEIARWRLRIVSPLTFVGRENNQLEKSLTPNHFARLAGVPEQYGPHYRGPG